MVISKDKSRFFSPKFWLHLAVTKAIFPAFTLFPAKNRLKKGRKMLQDAGGERVKLFSGDGVHLDGMFFQGEIRDKVIIFAGGNGEIYELNAERIDFFRQTGYSVLVFNPRGVGESSGIPSEKGLVEDVCSLYHYLIEERGIEPSSILFYGRSLGSGYGALALAEMQKRYPDQPLHFFSERSFGDLPSVINALVGKGTIGRALSSLALYCGWQLDAKEALNQIKGRKGVVFHALDRVIEESVQLSQHADCKDVVFIELIDDPNMTYAIDHCHNRSLYHLECIEIQQHISNIFEQTS